MQLHTHYHSWNRWGNNRNALCSSEVGETLTEQENGGEKTGTGEEEIEKKEGLRGRGKEGEGVSRHSRRDREGGQRARQTNIATDH